MPSRARCRELFPKTDSETYVCRWVLTLRTYVIVLVGPNYDTAVPRITRTALCLRPPAPRLRCSWLAISSRLAVLRQKRHHCLNTQQAFFSQNPLSCSPPPCSPPARPPCPQKPNRDI